jgi:hypothetical protein
MDKERMPKEAKVNPLRTPEGKDQAAPETQVQGARSSALAGLHRSIGNQAVQRLIAQRGGSEVDEETAERIDRARGSGQALDSAVQAQMGASMGQDFGGVQVHTSPEADALNQRLSAQAFTTGQDIFFREGAYDPNSSAGQELIAHELTHVVQQGSGAVGGGGRLTVNAPGDTYEQEADATARQVTGAGPVVQQQPVEEEEEEEEALQPKLVQRQDEEELVPPEAAEEEEEEIQPKLVQRQDEEELVPPEAVEEEEEALQPKRL